jgi:uncharacterized membrane protein
MRPPGFFFLPLTFPFFLALVLFALFVFMLIEINVIGYAYERIGIHQRYLFLVLLLSLLGSAINILVAHFPAEQFRAEREVAYFGMRYVIPVVENWPQMLLAVNVGGAVIPTVLSLYLVVHNKLYVQSLAGICVVALVTHWLARPLAGVGIAVPMFLPPIVAAVTAVVLSSRATPSLAYIAGSLGTLIGADLLNLDKLRGLGAPVVSIGGAGTFDGIFLAGILAALLA